MPKMIDTHILAAAQRRARAHVSCLKTNAVKTCLPYAFSVVPFTNTFSGTSVYPNQRAKANGPCRRRPRSSGYRNHHGSRCTAEVTRNIDKLAVEARTLAWARLIVCGLRLCPFAEPVLDANSVRLTVSDAEDERQVRKALDSELAMLLRSSPLEVSTTLLVMPKFATTEFLRFHQLCGELTDEVEGDEELVDEVMLACFHPQHQWGDSESADDAINFDKRAPYPIINLLRAPEVDKYVEEGKTQRILERNQATLEHLGSEELKKLYRSL